MNATFRQDTREGRLETEVDLGLALVAFQGTERLNGLFDYEVECISSNPEVDFDQLIGTHATVLIDAYNGPAEPFDGIVTEARWLGAHRNGFRYRLRLQPWFFLATMRRNQRIFHTRSVVQILQDLLAGYSDAGTLETRLASSYPELEYTVQFSESDFAFASRQMERFGISYHFEHSEGAHKMVLSDRVEPHRDIGTRPFRHQDNQNAEEFEHFWLWEPARRVTTGAIRLTDYNFKSPRAAMEADKQGDAAFSNGQIESFDWPGDYLDHGAGKLVASLRANQERGQDARFQAQGNVVGLRAGARVKLKGAGAPGSGKEFVCLSAQHSFTSNSYSSGDGDGEDEVHRATYTLMPSKAPLAPERKTPRALVHGPQTARVVGEGEIDCDEYGRILVRFHWDLDDAYSMRCRVSQNWAGSSWGGSVIPRIGMEVVVEFFDGDPDKPLVTGCVFNGKNAKPYPLPQHKTKAVFRTDSHQGSGFNELSFEDQSGQENIALHAQKDQTLKVLNNRMKRVNNDQVESVGRNKAVDVARNHQENIGGSMNVSVGGGGGFGLVAALAGIAAAGGQDALAGAEAVGDKAISGFVGGLAQVGAAVEAMTGAAAGAFRGAGDHKSVAGAAQAAAGSALGELLSTTMPISGVLNTVVEKFVSDTIGLARTEQIGAYKNTSVGHTMTVHVGKEFLINCGKSKFIMDSDGNVTIIGTKFNFTASGHVQINGKIIDLN